MSQAGIASNSGGGGGGTLDTLTPDSGGAVSPTAGNINVFGIGGNVTLNAGSSTLDIDNEYWLTAYVVDPDTTPGSRASYSTIQSAMDAANSAGGAIVYVRPGTYTEDLTLYNNVNVTGLTFADTGGGVVINGTHVPPDSGGFSFNNVALNSATAIFNSTDAGTAHLLLANAIVNVTNGYSFNVPNWTGKLESFDVNAAIGTDDGYILNTGGSTVAIFNCSVGSGVANNMVISGAFPSTGAAFYCPVQLLTGASAEIDGAIFNATVIMDGSSSGSIYTSAFTTGAQPAIIMNSTGNWIVSQASVTSTNFPAIDGTGTGTLSLGGIAFSSGSNINPSLTVASVGEFFPGGDLGNSGYVYTSNGTGFVPTFQAAPSGGVTLAGDTGTASGSTINVVTAENGGASLSLTGDDSSTITLSDTDSNDNVFLGSGAGFQALGNGAGSCVGVGYQSSYNLAGQYNVAIGRASLSGGGFGTYNIAIGYGAGSSYTGAESHNIVLGASVDPSVMGEGGTIHIGTQLEHSACFIGGISGVTVSSSAAVLIDTTTGQLGTVISSERYKDNIEPMGDTSLLDLEPVTFTYKSDTSRATQYGLIAEQVHKVIPELVVLDKDGNPDSVQYHILPSLLLNEIKKLNARITELEKRAP